MSFFDSSASTQVAQHIEHATSPRASIDDITLHLEICDLINETRDGHKHAAKTLKKKLSVKCDDATLLKALNIIETTMKNCNKRYHIQITSKDFIATVMKVYEKTQTRLIKEKILGMIQAWADAFRSDPNMQYLCTTHQNLILKGVEFPAQNLDELAPIHTPDPSVTPQAHHGREDLGAPKEAKIEDNDEQQQQPKHLRQRSPQSMSQVAADEAYARQLAQQLAAEERTNPGQPSSINRSSLRSPCDRQAMSAQHGPQASERNDGLYPVPLVIPEGERVTADQQQQDKIKNDLTIVHNNCDMLREMLVALGPDDDLGSSDVISELHVACKRMRTRLIQLINQLENEDLLSICLVANDKLADVLEFYDEIEQKHKKKQQQAQQQQPKHDQRFSELTGEEDAMELPWRPTHVSPTPINVIQDPFSTQAVQSNNPQQGLTSSDLSQQSQQQTNQEKLGSPWNPADPLSSAHTPSKSPTMTSSNLNAIHGDLTNSFAPNERNHALKSNPSTIAPPFYQKTDGTSERQPDQSRSAHVSIIDDPFGVPSPLEVSDDATPLAPTMGKLNLTGATTTSSNVDDFDPFKQHEGSLSDSRKIATSYELPEPDSQMLTFSAVMHKRRQPLHQPMDEPDEMDNIEIQQTKPIVSNPARRGLGEVKQHRRFQMEDMNEDPFGL